MTVGFGKRYLVISVRIERALGRTVELPDAVEATDAELAHLGRHDPRLDRRMVEAQLGTYGFRPIS
jgi:hypothetical protein